MFLRQTLAPGKRLYIDLGEVEVLAEVIINGTSQGILWKPPFLADITPAVRTGENTLEVKVTNLWPNRLIGDEQLPEENEYVPTIRGGAIKTLPAWYKERKPKPPGGRVTSSTWKHYSKDSPLLLSGLLGPVILRPATVYKVPF